MRTIFYWLFYNTEKLKPAVLTFTGYCSSLYQRKSKMQTTIGSKTLLDHQVAAVQWMMEKEAHTDRRVGGLLCDEMGLGKTLSVIGLCINNKKPRTLILTPLAVVGQWLAAFKDANFTVWEFKDGSWCKFFQGDEEAVFITNTDKMVHKYYAFEGFWDRVVIDEAHIVRNADGEKYKKIKGLYRKATWCLTATPIVNKLVDVCNLLHLVKRRITAKKVAKNKKAVLALMEEYSMARTTEMVRAKLDIFPDEADVFDHSIDFGNEEEALFYRGVQGSLKAELMERIAEHDKNMTAIFEILLRLRQLSVHPQIYIEGKRRKLGGAYKRTDWNGDSAKVGKLVDLITSSDEPHKWVVFCQFIDEMELLQERLLEEDCISKVWAYNGSMSQEARAEVVEKTKKPLKTKHHVLLLQIHSGGTGLNLQHMDRVVFTSPWWTAALMDQAVGRVMRIGQEKKVEVHHLKLKEGESFNIDELIFKKIEEKRILCEEVLAAAKCETEITVEDIESESDIE